MVVAVAVLLTGLEYSLLRSVAGRFTPAMLPVVGINTVGTLGYMLYAHIGAEASVSFQFPPTGAFYESAVWTMLAFTACLTVGAVLATVAASGRPGSLHIQAGTKLRVPRALIWACALVPLVVLIIGKGSALIEAPVYLSATGPAWAVRLGGALVPVGLLGTSFAFFSQEARNKTLATVALAGWVVVLFAIGTRQLALVPALLLVGYALAPRQRAPHIGPVKLAAVGAIGLVVAQVPLILRGTAAGVGLRPFLARIADEPSILWSTPVAASIGNVLFATPLTGYVADYGTVMTGDFWTSVNPLPSGFTDWATRSPGLRINTYTPYSGLGELGALARTEDWLYLVGFGVLVGVALAASHRIVSGLNGGRRFLASALVVGLPALFTLDVLEYNLRSATRIIWYLLFGLALVRLWPHLRRAGKQNAEEGEVGGVSVARG